MNEELDAVNSLKDWERGTLAEVDPNYECSDDSENEDKKKKVVEVIPDPAAAKGKKKWTD